MKAFPHKRIEEYEYEVIGELSKEKKTRIAKREVLESGMELRDYFASKAMQAYVSTLHNVASSDFQSADKTKEICNHSYEIADAMIEARK